MNAMTELGNGLSDAGHHENALSVREADLATRRRFARSEFNVLVAQSNLAGTYDYLGRPEDALSMHRDVYFGYVKIFGEQHRETFLVAENYALSLRDLKRFQEAKSLLRKTIRMARRVLGASDPVTLKMRWSYATTLYGNSDATLDDLREAVATLEDTARTAKRVLGCSHPRLVKIEGNLRDARAVLRAREPPAA